METNQSVIAMPCIGDAAPEFKAVTTQGNINVKCYDWFFCTKKLPEDKVMAEIKKKKLAN